MKEQKFLSRSLHLEKQNIHGKFVKTDHILDHKKQRTIIQTFLDQNLSQFLLPVEVGPGTVSSGSIT